MPARDILGRHVYFSLRTLPHNDDTAPWNGSLANLGGDQTGLQYMRNRYYNPATGQFTQEDPIGLAGGLNLYGFAGGDPVNFSDPFGLFPCCVLPVNSIPILIDDAVRSLIFQHFHETVVPKLDQLGQAAALGAVLGGAGRARAGAIAAEEGVYVGAAETRVSRWMSEGEYKAMKTTGTLQTNGRTFVTMPGAPKPGGTGPVRVDFNVPTDALKQAGREDWRVLYDPKKTPVTGIERVNPQ